MKSPYIFLGLYKYFFNTLNIFWNLIFSKWNVTFRWKMFVKQDTKKFYWSRRVISFSQIMERHSGKINNFFERKIFFYAASSYFCWFEILFLCNRNFVDMKHFFVRHQLDFIDTRLLFVQHQNFFFDTKLFFV